MSKNSCDFTNRHSHKFGGNKRYERNAMRNIHGAIRIVALLLLFSLAFAGHGVAQTSSRKESETRGAATAAKQAVLPDFVTLAEKLGPVVVNISTTQIIKGAPIPFEREDPLTEFWRRFFGEAYPPDFRQQGLGLEQ